MMVKNKGKSSLGMSSDCPRGSVSEGGKPGQKCKTGGQRIPNGIYVGGGISPVDCFTTLQEGICRSQERGVTQ